MSKRVPEANLNADMNPVSFLIWNLTFAYQAWVAVPQNHKDHWNVQVLPRRQRGDTVERELKLIKSFDIFVVYDMNTQHKILH